ncbi:hypothetical protein SIMMY50_207 [Erwinia phage vB_EamM_Simmy50]|uniref:Uncharacterized protein n=1 Tax=Erwinia phage vB_EamM_Simmy50 TaxID=1815988 RepID=A0A1Z2XX86_9CAUD|nr:hypothetical protein FDH99_gp319 [Erwinia phage vB_EamM_Simmy50]ASB43075.1 hypothetical protein SIMMY50_207 [Erwinia phage vB_EamM_Simmy50]
MLCVVLPDEAPDVKRHETGTEDTPSVIAINHAGVYTGT